MSSKSPHHTKSAKKSRAETDWERLRNECAWTRLSDMIKSIIDRAAEKPGDSVDGVIRFLYDESQLEIFVHSHELLGERTAEELLLLDALEKRFRDVLFLNELSNPGDVLSANSTSTLKMETVILLSKTLFYKRHFEEALSALDSAQLRNVEVSNSGVVSLSYMRLLLDAHVIRALSVEQLAVANISDDLTLAESTTKRIDTALQSAIDVLFAYAFEFDRRMSGEARGLPAAENAALVAFECNVFARIALDRAAFACARLGADALARLISRIRELLRGDLRVSTGGAAQSLRAHAATTLSRALIKHVSDASYEPPATGAVGSAGSMGPTNTTPGLSEAQAQAQTAPGASLHKVYTTPALTPTATQPPALATQPRGGRSRLAVTEQSHAVAPRSLTDELLLLLGVAEMLTKRNVVQSRARDLAEQRRATFAHAVDVLDSLTIVCARFGAYETLAERLERATEYSFNEPHVWRSFALALAESGQPYRSYLVLREWRRMQPRSGLVCTLLARVCLEQLASSSTHYVEEALESAKSACRLEPDNVRAQVLVGVACAMKARAERVREERDALQAEALKSFQSASAADPHDALAAYHVGLSHALSRNLKEAAAYSARAARLNPDCWYAAQLCVLVLSARREYEDAARLAAQLVEDWPSVLPLYVTKARLARLFNKKSAETLVAGLQRADAVFRDAFDAALGLSNGNASDSRSIGSPSAPLTPQTVFTVANESSGAATQPPVSAQSSGNPPSDKQSVRSDNYAPSAFGGVSMRDGGAMIETETERVFAEACRALCIYLRLAAELVDCYAQLDRLDAARAVVADCELRCARCCTCVETSLNELYNVRCIAALDYMRGLLLEYSRDWNGARDAYLSTVLCGEADVNCLQHLCTVLMESGKLQLAEKYIRDAISIEPQSSRSWEKLGLVLQAVGQHEAAIDCFTRAVELSQTEPIEPFTVLPLPVQ